MKETWMKIAQGVWLCADALLTWNLIILLYDLCETQTASDKTHISSSSALMIKLDQERLLHTF